MHVVLWLCDTAGFYQHHGSSSFDTDNLRQTPWINWQEYSLEKDILIVASVTADLWCGLPKLIFSSKQDCLDLAVIEFEQVG